MPIGAILGGALAGGGALLGGLSSSNAANKAAQLQYQAAMQALGFQEAIYGQTQANLAPFLQGGISILPELLQGLMEGGQFTTNPQNAFGPPPTLGQLPTYSPSAGQFHASPGYQFQREQGIGAMQNAATGPQGSLSGNMLNKVGEFGTGLANQDYNNWLQNVYNPTFKAQQENVLIPYQAANQNYWQNVGQGNISQQNILRALMGMTGMGQNAAVSQGGFGQNFGNSASNLITSGGNALASGVVGSNNAMTGGINSFINSLLSPNLGSNTNLNSILGLFGLGGGDSGGEWSSY